MSPASASPTAHESNLNEIARRWPGQHPPQRGGQFLPAAAAAEGRIVLITPGGAVRQVGICLHPEAGSGVRGWIDGKLLEPPVSVDHHGMARRREESG
jgi:hypothetical protein